MGLRELKAKVDLLTRDERKELLAYLDELDAADNADYLNDGPPPPRELPSHPEE